MNEVYVPFKDMDIFYFLSFFSTISDQNYYMYFLESFLPLSIFDIFNSYPPRT